MIQSLTKLCMTAGTAGNKDVTAVSTNVDQML